MSGQLPDTAARLGFARDEIALYTSVFCSEDFCNTPAANLGLFLKHQALRSSYDVAKLRGMPDDEYAKAVKTAFDAEVERVRSITPPVPYILKTNVDKVFGSVLSDDPDGEEVEEMQYDNEMDEADTAGAVQTDKSAQPDKNAVKQTGDVLRDFLHDHSAANVRLYMHLDGFVASLQCMYKRTFAAE